MVNIVSGLESEGQTLGEDVKVEKLAFKTDKHLLKKFGFHATNSAF